MPTQRNEGVRIAALLTAVLLVAATVFAQSPTRSTSSETTRFDVASIKPASFENVFYFEGFAAAAGNCAAARAQIAGNRVSYRRATLCGLIRLAYDVKDYQVLSMPAWMTRVEPSIFFDIDTRAAEGTTPTPEQARRMLQALLADRFQVRLHRESRELPVYALVIARDGPKFTNDGPSPCPGQPRATIMGGPGLFASCGPTTTMAQLAQRLSEETDRAVVDRTGLTGGFAFRLAWSREGAPAHDDLLPSVFTAVQEQLGLRLDPQRMAIEALMIDRAERPSPN